MFRKGGSANEGITSGLRQGYTTGKRVKEVLAEMQEALPQRNRRQNLNDFLTGQFGTAHFPIFDFFKGFSE